MLECGDFGLMRHQLNDTVSHDSADDDGQARNRASLKWWALAVVLDALASAPFMLSGSGHGLKVGRYRLDLDVYRIGGSTWLHGLPLYGALPATSDGTKGLPFSYPPISAVLLSPLSLVPLTVAEDALTLLSVVLLAVVLRVFLRSLAAAGVATRWQVKWLLPLALLLEPVRNTLNYGQINIILMTLVAVDCLYRGPGRTRGALVGIAAAVKLTPLAFILFFLVKKDYRAAGTAAFSFLGCIGLGFVLAWHDSVKYWTSIIFQPGRDGSVAYAANQSIQAVLSRAGASMTSHLGTVLWLLLSLLTLGVAYAGMCRAREQELDAWVLSLNALAALLISPISWSHHWVWGEPVLLSLLLIGWRLGNRASVVVALAGIVILAVAPHWLINAEDPNGLTWSLWQQVAGSSYVILDAVILACSVTLFSWRRPARSPRAEPAPEPVPEPAPEPGKHPQPAVRLNLPEA